MSAAAVASLRTRVRGGLSHSANWWQTARFLAVGASGFAINLAVFSVLVHALGWQYSWAAVASNSVALASNFMCNRSWTFKATHGRVALQAHRFVLVSSAGFLVNLMVLQFAVEVLGGAKLPSEMLASAFAAPVNFLGSRQWAFRSGPIGAGPAMASPRTERSAA